MDKKIKIELDKNKSLIELWQFNKKGYYNFKNYLPLTQESIKILQKQYKQFEIIDKQEILAMKF